MKLMLTITFSLFLLVFQIRYSSCTTRQPFSRPFHSKRRNIEVPVEEENFDVPETYQTQCNVEQIKNRLMKFEEEINEKTGSIRSEVLQNNRRLERIEQQNVEVQSMLENFRTEFVKLLSERDALSATGETQYTLKKVQQQLGYLSKGSQLLVASMRNVASDIAGIKKNLSHVANVTNLQILNDAELLERKYRQKYEVHDSLTYNNKSIFLPRNCKSLQEKGKLSGIYRIQPSEISKPFMVMCEMTIKGGGWTYIHNRYDGMQDFYLNWHDYKHGFGNIAGEFWLGLQHIHELTGDEVNELLIELTDAEEETRYAHYSAFSIGSEAEGFPLKVLGGYEGDAGDALKYHAGSRFSTKDVDQDAWEEGSCARSQGGAWWYRSCSTSNLNGKYFVAGELPDQYVYNGMYWNTFKGPKYNLLRARMFIRPRDEHSSPIVSLDSRATLKYP